MKHYPKAKGIADWLIARRGMSLAYAKTDGRFGMLPGSDEADNYAALYYHQGTQLHFFSATAEAYRAFAEIGLRLLNHDISTFRHFDICPHPHFLLEVVSVPRCVLPYTPRKTLHMLGKLMMLFEITETRPCMAEDRPGHTPQ